MHVLEDKVVRGKVQLRLRGKTKRNDVVCKLYNTAETLGLPFYL